MPRPTRPCCWSWPWWGRCKRFGEGYIRARSKPGAIQPLRFMPITTTRRERPDHRRSRDLGLRRRVAWMLRQCFARLSGRCRLAFMRQVGRAAVPPRSGLAWQGHARASSLAAQGRLPAPSPRPWRRDRVGRSTPAPPLERLPRSNSWWSSSENIRSLSALLTTIAPKMSKAW